MTFRTQDLMVVPLVDVLGCAERLGLSVAELKEIVPRFRRQRYEILANHKPRTPRRNRRSAALASSTLVERQTDLQCFLHYGGSSNAPPMVVGSFSMTELPPDAPPLSSIFEGRTFFVFQGDYHDPPSSLQIYVQKALDGCGLEDHRTGRLDKAKVEVS
jgi:hypothetical protein